MSKSNGFLLNFTIVVIIFLIIVSASSPKFLVSASSSSVPQSNRQDPLNHFKSYNGGYDIRSRHYWASAIFTGVHGYAMAGIWVLGGLGFGIFVAVKHFNGSSPAITEHSDSYYFLPFVLIVLFTFLAIVASGFILAANKNFVWKAKKMERTILGSAGEARVTIRKVANAMEEMNRLLSPYNEPAGSQLNATSQKLEREAKVIRHVVYKNRRWIDYAIKILYGATIAIVSTDLVFVVAAVVLLLMHWHPGLIIIIFLCWISVTLCWVLTGAHFSLHTFAEDTCAALWEFEQKPGNNSLDSVFPCLDQVYGDHVMIQIGSTVYKFINKLNSKVSVINQILGLTKQNEDSSTTLNWKICNPFTGAPNFTYNPSICPEGDIPIGDVPHVLARFTCYKENSTLSCLGEQKLISESSYDMAMAYSQSVQNLLNVLPDLRNLTECSFVKDTFSTILSKQCRPLRASIKRLWISSISLSIIMVILVILWVTKAWQDRGRRFSRCSLIPQSTTQTSID